MKRVFVPVLLLSGACGGTSSEAATGHGAGAAACLHAPMLLHAGRTEERPYASRWSDGHYLVGSAGVEPAFSVLEPCSGSARPIDDVVEELVATDEELLACDDATGVVRPVDAVGSPVGESIAVAQDCEMSSVSVDGENVWSARDDTGGLHLFDTEGTVAVVEGLEVGDAPWIDSVWGTPNASFIVMESGSMWVVGARTGEAELVATGVFDPFVRGSRVFFGSTEDERVQVYDTDTRATLALPSTLLSHDCALNIEGDWYMQPAAGQTYCSRASAVGLVHVGSAEAFEVPSGFHLDGVLSNGEILLVGDAVAVWAPGLHEPRTIWPQPTGSVSEVPGSWGLNVESVLVEDEGSGTHRRVVVPLDGSEPFGLFGEHASSWAYYGNGNLLIGLTPDFELVRYDRTTDALEIVAPKIVDADYFAEDLGRGHPRQLIFEVGDLYDPEVVRELWAMPLPD